MPASVISVLVVQDSAGTRAYKLDRNIYFIGRSKQSDIQIFDQQASRTHATLIRVLQPMDECNYKILDGDARTGRQSQNGTQLNNGPLKEQDLHNRDSLIFGPMAKATYFHLDSRFEYDLLSAPERWMREHVNQPQETETVVVNLAPETTVLAPIPAAFYAPSQMSAPLLNAKDSSIRAQRSFQAAPNLKLGQFLVRSTKIKTEQLQLALKLQTTSKKRIGEVLVEKGWVTKEDVRQALINQKTPIGNILLQRKSITPHQLIQALLKQINNREYLGQILVKEGVISFDELDDALQEQQLRRKGFWCLK